MGASYEQINTQNWSHFVIHEGFFVIIVLKEFNIDPFIFMIWDIT